VCVCVCEYIILMPFTLLNIQKLYRRSTYHLLDSNVRI